MAQPETLRLAQDLDAYHTRPDHKLAAAELRRLHAVNAELLEAMKLIASCKSKFPGDVVDIAQTAISKTEGGV